MPCIGPFLFAFSPGFLLGGPGHFISWYQVISTMVTIVLGTIAFGSLTMGYFLCPTTVFEWCLSAVATVLLFFPQIFPWATGMEVPTFVVDAIGIGLWVVVYFTRKIRIRKDPTLTLPIFERQRLKQEAAA
jgi:TRAP-type uncharacterized transport system fused permease subunit